MIIETFTIPVGRKNYTFIDRSSIDSNVERQAVEIAIIAQLQASQQDAMCAALGINELEIIPNFGFGVYDGDTRIGVYLMASCLYISGPWDNLRDWNVISDDPALINGRHMPGFSGLTPREEQDLSAEATYHFLSRNLPTAGGNAIRFKKISWAIFTDRTDPNSLRDIAVHNKIITDIRLKATLVPDISDEALTRVDVELR